jgi:hypothetical protein
MISLREGLSERSSRVSVSLLEHSTDVEKGSSVGQLPSMERLKSWNVTRLHDIFTAPATHK